MHSEKSSKAFAESGAISGNSYWDLWNLSVDQGRQVWEFDPDFDLDDEAGLEEMSGHFKFDKRRNANSGDRVYRYLKRATYAAEFPDWLNDPETFRDALTHKAAQAHFKGIRYYTSLQAEDGHWPGDYGGPLFLLPGLIFASFLTESPFPKPHQALMKRYMLNHQNEDGGWGLHIEGPSTMFGSVLQYVALRLLAEAPESEPLVRARDWIQEQGGARGIPSWGKFYLSLLNLYEWEGCNPLLPELWLLPKSLFIHPSRYWCHARMVFLPMTYCYGHRIRLPLSDLILSIREEIYCEPYNDIPWSRNGHTVASTDDFWPASPWVKAINRILRVYEKNHVGKWRKKALDFALDYVRAEDEQTEYVDIGPVNQIINSICMWHAGGRHSEPFKRHVERWFDYLWVAEDGMKMNGYNGSQLWDTAFATQAILEDGRVAPYFSGSLGKAYAYIDQSQVRTEISNGPRFFRHPSLGGWPFSTHAHGWPISDCTAEGLCSVLKLHQLNLPAEGKAIEAERLKRAADLILSLQNKDGGWATYENTRSTPLLEILNTSEIFGQIMIDYSWTECTSACIKALSEFRRQDPGYRQADLQKAIRKGIGFILSQQRSDGSWRGAWGLCFTYGAWFALEALSHDGKTYQNEAAVAKGCAFLIAKQNPDGGWGESYQSCVKGEYVPHEHSQVVNTAWAIMALLAADYPDKQPIERGIGLLIDRQQDNGDWLQEGISGVFNQNCMITYTSYRNVFTIWALAKYLKKYN